MALALVLQRSRCVQLKLLVRGHQGSGRHGAPKPAPLGLLRSDLVLHGRPSGGGTGRPVPGGDTTQQVQPRARGSPRAGEAAGPAALCCGREGRGGSRGGWSQKRPRPRLATTPSWPSCGRQHHMESITRRWCWGPPPPRGSHQNPAWAGRLPGHAQQGPGSQGGRRPPSPGSSGAHAGPALTDTPLVAAPGTHVISSRAAPVAAYLLPRTHGTRPSLLGHRPAHHPAQQRLYFKFRKVRGDRGAGAPGGARVLNSGH